MASAGLRQLPAASESENRAVASRDLADKRCGLMGWEPFVLRDMPGEGEDEEVGDDLSPGVSLLHGQYRIERYLNSGGFGITYLAQDSLDRRVVIKECFPGAFCRRSKTVVRPRLGSFHDEFQKIVRLFLREAKNLAKLDHPNIVGVHQVFEDNDTAYMALDHVDGRDLLAVIEDETTPLAPAQIVHYLTKLLQAVDYVHQRGMLHRDISPDNVLIGPNDEPVLIDFGAARVEAVQASRALSAVRVVKDGYSPQEFYVSGMSQGPSSDLYSLAATFYHAISGDAPANSQRRLAALFEGRDPCPPLAGRFEGYPPGFLEAIDRAMRVLPKDRFGYAEDWLDAIAAPVEAVVEIAAPAAPAPAVQAVQAPAHAGTAPALSAEAPAPRPSQRVNSRVEWRSNPGIRGGLMAAGLAALTAFASVEAASFVGEGTGRWKDAAVSAAD